MAKTTKRLPVTEDSVEVTMPESMVSFGLSVRVFMDEESGTVDRVTISGRGGVEIDITSTLSPADLDDLALHVHEVI